MYTGFSETWKRELLVLLFFTVKYSVNILAQAV